MAIPRKSALNQKRKADLVDDTLDLHKELATLRKQIKGQAAQPEAVRKAAHIHQDEVIIAVADVTTESVVRQVTDVGLNTQRAFDNVTTQLVEATKTLDNVREAITYETTRLDNLHGIDIAQTSLAQLIANFDTRAADFEVQVEEASDAYDADVAFRETEQEDFDVQLVQDRKREQADYDYKLRIERRKTEGAYDIKIEDAERARKLKFETQDRERADQLAVLAVAEAELVELRQFHEGFDASIDEAREEAATEAKLAAERNAGWKAAIAGKDAESRFALVQVQFDNVSNQLVIAQTQIADLNDQITAANARNTDMAMQSLKSAEGQTALAELRSVTSLGRDTGGKGARN